MTAPELGPCPACGQDVTTCAGVSGCCEACAETGRTRMHADRLDVPADTWAPAPLRWRLVQAGDVFLSLTGVPFVVLSAELDRPHGMLCRVEATRGGGVHVRACDPDDVVRVLVPLVEREAFLTLREQLGATLIERMAS